MSYNDLPAFDLKFAPILKSREKVQAIVRFNVTGVGDRMIFAVMPFTNTKQTNEGVRQEVFAEAQAVANRWVLQFASAEAARELTAYDSLAASLMAIASTDFVIRKVIVREIIPLTPPIVPPKPEPPKPTFAERVTAPIAEAIPAFKAIKEMEKKVQQEEPDLWNDPDLGGLRTTTGMNSTSGQPTKRHGMLRSMFDDLAASVLTKRGPR